MKSKQINHPFYLFLLIIISSSTITIAQKHPNITLGSSLTAQNDNLSWDSVSGDFAFGFRKIENNAFLLAIWFNKIPEKTIVWSANRNQPVKKGSRIELTQNGQLVLIDSSQTEVWNSGSTGTSAVYATMLDNGNFVLVNKDSGLVWESFENPTDTILPGQVLKLNTQMFSSYLETNYSKGRFKLDLQSDGNLVLYTTNFPKDENNFAYWSTQDSINIGFQLIYNQSGYIYLTAKNNSIHNKVFWNLVSDQDFYQRAILEYDGVFRQYSYPKRPDTTKGWPMDWSILSGSLPSNICLRTGGDTGGGACGFNSYCSLDMDQQRPVCRCLPGYKFLDPNDERRGCMESFLPQKCDEDSQNLFEFNVMLNTDFQTSAYEIFEGQSEDWCRQSCLNDCFCGALVFIDGRCTKKQLPLSNGRKDSSIGEKTLIKVRKDNSTISKSCMVKQNNRFVLVLAESISLGISIFLNFLLVLVFCYRFGRSSKNTNDTTTPQVFRTEINVRSFTYNELEKATTDFNEEIGKGASSTVYKGVLPFENNEVVAVKKLQRLITESDHEFNTEVRAISKTNHKNLVQLLGYCNDDQHRLLVYEYMSNGSLSSFLFRNDPRPHWYKRVQIALGVAKGLLYLHDECCSQIIHCDIKPQNILLDDFLTAKISDFGLAKLLKKDQTRTNTGIRGTKGYVAPEWFRNMPITTKVDVYSFGILLLELVCCRKSFELDTKDENCMVLADWAYDCYEEGRLEELLVDDNDALNDIEQAKKFVMIAIWCIQEDPSLRPTMKKVTQMMEGTVKVSAPPDPNSFIGRV